MFGRPAPTQNTICMLITYRVIICIFAMFICSLEIIGIADGLHLRVLLLPLITDSLTLSSLATLISTSIRVNLCSFNCLRVTFVSLGRLALLVSLSLSLVLFRGPYCLNFPLQMLFICICILWLLPFVLMLGIGSVR